MTKRDEVEQLDTLIRKRMIKALEENELEILPLLSPAVNYVKANEVTLEKEKGSVEKSISQRTKEANARRKKKEESKRGTTKG